MSSRLRHHGIGDLGWIVSRHGVLYHREYGFDASFEALCARIAGEFLESFDATCERCWIAELDGRRVGSVCAVKQRDRVAQLRLLLLEPEARGHGIGSQLVTECVQFARDVGYDEMVLSTVSILTAARALYRKAGFEIESVERKRTWGHELDHELWRLQL